MDKLMLSIVVPTYGHGHYIREALDSILMQETKYRYEVLIGEDASPDSTRDILKEYEEKYPSTITVFYREENMGAYGNSMDLLLRCKGKYIIALEGDDFWLDADKIEKQVSFLESHREYIAVAHNCRVVDKESRPTGEKYPECKESEYSLGHYASDILPGQTATVMYRNCYQNHLFDISLLKMGLMPGDRLLYFTLICNGRIYCMQECKSAYRHVVDSGTSYSATICYDYRLMAKWYIAQIKYARHIKHKKGIQVAKILYLKNIVLGMRMKQLSVKNILEEMKKGDIGLKSLYLYVKQMINHHIFRRKIWI